MATTSGSLKRRLGAAAYFVQAARMAMRLSATPCRVTVDDELIETDATAVLIGNMGQLVPGRLGLRLPLDPSDGLLDLIVVGASSPVGGLRGLADQLRRTKLGGGSGDASIRRRGRRIRSSRSSRCHSRSTATTSARAASRRASSRTHCRCSHRPSDQSPQSSSSAAYHDMAVAVPSGSIVTDHDEAQTSLPSVAPRSRRPTRTVPR